MFCNTWNVGYLHVNSLPLVTFRHCLQATVHGTLLKDTPETRIPGHLSESQLYINALYCYPPEITDRDKYFGPKGVHITEVVPLYTLGCFHFKLSFCLQKPCISTQFCTTSNDFCSYLRFLSFSTDLRQLYYQAGVENKPTVFLFNDTQVVEESFLEDINNILSSGEVPNLYKPEEFEEVCVVCPCIHMQH